MIVSWAVIKRHQGFFFGSFRRDHHYFIFPTRSKKMVSRFGRRQGGGCNAEISGSPSDVSSLVGRIYLKLGLWYGTIPYTVYKSLSTY
eukprot:scaffold4528_cov162-Amphora_coffeaeformis.AAC.2